MVTVPLTLVIQGNSEDAFSHQVGEESPGIIPSQQLIAESRIHSRKNRSLGEEVPYFTLPSTQDRAINYVSEYYGKHHLVMTFFPAAFTPV